MAPDARRALVTLTPAPARDLVVEALFHLDCVDPFQRRPAWRVVASCEFTPGDLAAEEEP